MSTPSNNKIQIVKYSPPPSELPVLGDMDPKEVSFIGRTNYVAALEEKKYVFGIKRVDRRRHLYIVGKSGVGKSRLQELMIRQDIAHGYGVCVIDPHGELMNEILKFIPEERIGDVCVIDPTDTDHAVLFNPFSNVSPSFKHQLVQAFIEIFKKQFGSNWNSKLEHVLRFAVLALMDYPNATLRDMISLLTDNDYRQQLAEIVEDEMVKKFWSIEFKDWNDASVPLVNKLGQFLSDPMIRNIFSQTENKIDFEILMNNKKIILINLAKGEIGEDNASFLGTIFIAKIKQAGMARAKINKEDRNDFYIYADEFQNLVTDAFENIFTEGRKYGIALTLTHQYINQLSPKVQQAIMGNVGSMITFRVGGEDAVKLKPEYSPVFDVKDMINLGVGEFYIKMTIDGESFDPFSAETLKVLQPTHRSYKNEIIESSRKNFTTEV